MKKLEQNLLLYLKITVKMKIAIFLMRMKNRTRSLKKGYVLNDRNGNFSKCNSVRRRQREYIHILVTK